MFETPFFTNSESAFDADSFNTKIDENDENFKISDSDGRPDFTKFLTQNPTSDSAFATDSFNTKTINFDNILELSDADGRPDFSNFRPDLSPTDVTHYDNFNDSKIKLTPLTQCNNFNNLPKPRLLPVGPVSDDKSQISQMDYQPFTRDDTGSHINHTNVESDSESEPGSDIESEPEDLQDIDDSLLGRSEFLLKADVHYNPQTPDGLPNPEWIIVTCNPFLINRAPLFFNQSINATEGIIVARGQFKVVEGQPLINRTVLPLPITEGELNSPFLDPFSFFSAESIPVPPLSLCVSNSDSFLCYIFKVFLELIRSLNDYKLYF